MGMVHSSKMDHQVVLCSTIDLYQGFVEPYKHGRRLQNMRGSVRSEVG